MSAIRRVAAELAQNAARLEYPGHPGWPEQNIPGWGPHPRNAHQRGSDFYAAADSIALYARGWIDALGLERRPNDYGYAAGQISSLATNIAAAFRRRAKLQRD